MRKAAADEMAATSLSHRHFRESDYTLMWIAPCLHPGRPNGAGDLASK